MARKIGVSPPIHVPSLRLYVNAGSGMIVKPGPTADLVSEASVMTGWGIASGCRRLISSAEGGDCWAAAAAAAMMTMRSVFKRTGF